MLRLPVVAARLAALAGTPKLPAAWHQRLSAHVALHDLGKANRGFRQRWYEATPSVGHVAEAVALIHAGEEFGERLFAALPLQEMADWGAFDHAFMSIIAHHGRPQVARSDWSRCRALWKPGPDGDPVAELSMLGQAVRRWFPDAFATRAPQLPESPQFWHAIAGLTMLADWIGSDEQFFAFANGEEPDRMAWARERAPEPMRELGFDPAEQRSSFHTIPEFKSISEHAPRPMQGATGDAVGNIAVLESETGSGKTEAALYRFARLFAAGTVDGLYFALPTRVAATSLYDRVRTAVDRLFPEETRPTVLLAVPGYAKADGVRAHLLPGFEVQWDDDPLDAQRRARWAAERPKRFLAGTIAVGTIDQALLGAITVKHAHMRAACLLRHLLVVDEVHASDSYMETLLTHLLDFHVAAGGHALLLSATLGAAARCRLLRRPEGERPSLAEAEALPYPAISTSSRPAPECHEGAARSKIVAMALDPRSDAPHLIAGEALAAARAGAKVLVVRNLHSDAVATAEALFALAPGDAVLFRCEGIPTLHHGRFAREDRALLDAEVDRAIGRERPPGGLVLIGTQTLEQSLDIDADFLITDLCPADVLLQRLGRLHRHDRENRTTAFAEARALVLCPPELAPLLQRGRHGLGGRHGPYHDVIALAATRRLILAHPTWTIPQMNRMLVERATHPEALAALTVELERSDRRWREAATRTDGRGIGDQQAAALARLNWRTAFPELAFPEAGEAVATRLGARDLGVTFAGPGPKGPFGEPVLALSIPHFWLDGIDLAQPADPHEVVERSGGFSFQIQASRYEYDNFGLRRGPSDGGTRS
jgi:CRISPR-associated endonuclease/helicase Cas3